MIQTTGPLWNYLSSDQKTLAQDGAFLVQDSEIHKDEPTDYSYLVFPFAKLYEGFLKDVFLDLRIIEEREYKSKYFRIGKVLSPNLVRRLGKRSAYKIIQTRYGEPLSHILWTAWKEGRNLVFHYFPNNFICLSREDALNRIALIEEAMKEVVIKTNPRRNTT